MSLGEQEGGATRLAEIRQRVKDAGEIPWATEVLFTHCKKDFAWLLGQVDELQAEVNNAMDHSMENQELRLRVQKLETYSPKFGEECKCCGVRAG